MIIASIVGEIQLQGDLGTWNVTVSAEQPEPGLELIHIKLRAESPQTPPHLFLAWDVPQLDMHSRWHPKAHLDRHIPADWAGPVASSLSSSAPVMQLRNLENKNRLLFAVSEALRLVQIKAGVCEESNCIACSVELFSVPEAPIECYETVLRLDTRPLFYAERVCAAFDWFASFPEYKPSPAPEAAFEPIYSTWYSYHQNVFAQPLEAECAAASKYGMKGIIVDDGWQTDDTNRGYAFCGDWEIARNRFPEMRAHVAEVHRLGLNYILWYSVPFVGENSRNVELFRGKFLYKRDNLKTYVLDPRFPEVREFLISTYETALREWDLDGFKLDFIDSFYFNGADPALAENYTGRDIKSLPMAVDKLLGDVMMRLNAIKPGVLIEFRQSYIGPAIRKYGNMLRAGDCPGDLFSNRVSTIDLRLTSGNTAVHSDMLEWNGNERPEIAALQILNILFSVPQISVRLDAISEVHRQMLSFWLGFWKEHRDVLLHGRLMPYHPELNYPLVTAENAAEMVVAVYDSGRCVPVEGKQGRTCFVVNASGCSSLLLEIRGTPKKVEAFNALGDPVSVTLSTGFIRLTLPVSGLLVVCY